VPIPAWHGGYGVLGYFGLVPPAIPYGFQRASGKHFGKKTMLAGLDTGAGRTCRRTAPDAPGRQSKALEPAWRDTASRGGA